MKASNKDILREIKKSGMRFFYISAIIALGVAFFCGIKATAPSMVQTAVDYFSNSNLSDFKLISTYGFRDEDIKTLSRVDGVEEAVGAYSMDVIMQIGEDKDVIKILSLPATDLNAPELLEGRFPTQSNECVIESTKGHIQNTEIGQKITVLNESHTEEELDNLKSKEFTIVGYIRSPQYISIERGNTNISDGTIDGYMMVPVSTFNYERFTEAYIYTDVSAQNTDPYSDEYSKAQEQMIASLEKAGDQILDDNIYSIRLDALQEINNHQRELDDNKATLDRETSKAKDKLAAGEKELNQGYAAYNEGVKAFKTEIAAAQALLNSGEIELENGFSQYEIGRKQMTQLIMDGQNKLLAGKDQLSIGYMSYKQGLDQFNQKMAEAEYEIAQGEKELEEGFRQYNEGLEEFNSQIIMAETQLDQAQAQLDVGLNEFNAAQEKFDKEIGEAQDQLDVAWDKYYSGLNSYNTSLKNFENEVNQAQNKIDTAQNDLTTGEAAYQKGLKDLEAGRASYNTANSNFQNQLPGLNSQLASLRSQLNEVNSQIAQLENEYAPVKNQYNEINGRLKEADSNLSSLKSSLSSLQSKKSSNDSRIAAINNQLKDDPTNAALLEEKANLESQNESLNSQISSVNSEITAAQTNRDSIQAELDSISGNYNSYQNQLNELTNKKNSLTNQISEIENTINTTQSQLNATKAQLDKTEKELQTTRSKLDQAKVDLENAKNQLAQKKEQGLAQLESAKAQLEATYNQIYPLQQELDEKRNMGQAELDEAYKPLKEAQDEIDKSREELESKKQAGLAELNTLYGSLLSAQEQIKDSKVLLETSRIQGLNELANALTELLSAEEELRIGEITLENSRVEGEQQLASAYQTLIVGQQELEEGRAQFNAQRISAQNELSMALNALILGQNELDAGRRELYLQLADGQLKIDEAQEELNKARTEVEDLSRGEWYVYDRDDNPGYTGYQEDSERIDKVANVFPMFFFLVAALVAFSTMTRMIEEERTQIGTLYALGYTKNQILKKYVVYAGVAALIGSTFGWILGVMLLPRLIFTAYSILYSLPDLELNIPWNIIIISYLISLFCTVGAAILIALAELRSVPAELMRPKAPKPGKRILLERIPFIWNRLNFISKVSMRNIFRYKARFMMTVLGIAGCTGLILAGFGLHDAIFTIIPNQFGNIFKYDQSLIVEDTDTPIAPKLTEVIADERVQGAMPADQQSITVKTEDGTLNAYLIVPYKPDELEDFIGLHKRDSTDVISLTNDGVIVSEKLATNYGAEPGNTITLQIDNKPYQVKVSAQTENYLQNYIYMTPAYYEQVTGSPPEYSIVMINFADNVTSEEDQLAFASDMIDSGDYTSAINTSTIVDTSTKTMDSLNILVVVMIVSAGILAFIVLNNLTNINISERMREIATLKVLGFRDKETNNYIFRENIVLSIFGIAVGLVLGILLLKFIIFTVELDIIMFGRKIYFMSYVYAILITLVFTVIVNFTMIPVMRKVNMVEALKDID